MWTCQWLIDQSHFRALIQLWVWCMAMQPSIFSPFSSLAPSTRSYMDNSVPQESLGYSFLYTSRGKNSNATAQSDSALLLAPFPLLPTCAKRSVCTALGNQSDSELTRRREAWGSLSSTSPWALIVKGRRKLVLYGSFQGKGRGSSVWCLEKADIYCTNVLLKAPSSTN